jgi:ribonuclease BN (tRNA processing enzyme)
MDHLQGLGFFRPLRTSGVSVHIWGPASTRLSLRARLARYLSPPLFPVVLRDLECELRLHEVPSEEINIPGFEIKSALVVHPDPTVGYRIREGDKSVTFLPDHEPALGAQDFPGAPEWVSGCQLAEEVDVLIHDSQYTEAEYAERVGWGHSSQAQMIAFARLARVKRLVPYHHDPSHSDDQLDQLFRDLIDTTNPSFPVTPAREGMSIEQFCCLLCWCSPVPVTRPRHRQPRRFAPPRRLLREVRR